MSVDPMYGPVVSAQGGADDEDSLKERQPRLVTTGGKEVVAAPGCLGVGSSHELALSVFQTKMTNNPEDRHNISNLMDIWDLIPRFFAEGFNSLEGKKGFPNSVTRSFTLGETSVKATLMPGYFTANDRQKGAVKSRRYPGHTEAIVEQALIKIAADQAYLDNDESPSPNGTLPSYSFHFSLGELQRVVAKLGAKRSKHDIRQALEVLRTSNVEIIGNLDDKEYYESTSLLTSLKWIGEEGKSRSTGAGSWQGTLNGIISQGIINIGYRQYRLDDAKGLRYFGTYIYRKLMVERLNLSATQGLSFLFSEIKELTFGLNYKAINKGITELEKEIQKMVDMDIISGYDVVRAKGRVKTSTRAVLVDARFTIYPSGRSVKQMKVASAKNRAGATILGKSMENHNQRRFQLPLLLPEDNA